MSFLLLDQPIVPAAGRHEIILDGVVAPGDQPDVFEDIVAYTECNRSAQFRETYDRFFACAVL
jgi:hypothetical protein